jgi:hypothetical protein
MASKKFRTSSIFASSLDKTGNRTFDEILYLLNSIENEIAKGHQTGFLDTSYINDKMETIQRMIEFEDEEE